MLQLRKPPMHKVDGLAVLVLEQDSSWDRAKIAADRLLYEAAALKRAQDAAVQEFIEANPDRQVAEEELEAVRAARSLTFDETVSACDLSPITRYFAGVTRYQLDAPDWDASGAPTTARAYLTKKPDITFKLRRLSHRQFWEVCSEPSGRLRMVEACAAGLRAIVSDGYNWEGERATDDVMELLHATNPMMVLDIGAAVLSLSRPLDEDEKKPAPVGA